MPFEGKDITQTPAHQLVTQDIADAPEGRRIFSRLTVLENLQMGAFTRHPAESATARAGAADVSADSRNGCGSAAVRCPAASSRCSPSPEP